MSEQLPQPRGIASGRRDEEDTLAFPAAQALDQWRQRWVAALQMGLLADIARKKGLHGKRGFLGALGGGHDTERLPVHLRERRERRAPFMFVEIRLFQGRNQPA